MIIGFDFGTHQTKICVGDYSYSQRPVFRFWKFNTPKGETYALPSIIQINSDDRLQYGYVDEKKVKYMPLRAKEKPILPNLKEPVMEFTEKEPILKLPPKPQAKKMDWKEQLKAISMGVSDYNEEWEKECEEARLDYDQDIHIWKSKHDKAQKKYDEEMAIYAPIMDKYKKEYSEWEQSLKNIEPAIFRYFKQATFCNSIQWPYTTIDKDLLSIWYIAYILFDIEEQYGKENSIQIGFPASASTLHNRRNHAVRLILSAYDLVENKFHNDKQAFLASTYQELEQITEIIQPTNKLKEEFGILALPEAYANLVTTTTQRKITNGISFVVDIGGGTTDISLFNIDGKNEPHIYGYTSIEVGINSLVETVLGSSSKWKQNSLDDLNKVQRELVTHNFHAELNTVISDIVRKIYAAFDKVALPTVELTRALKDRIIVYSGGGSTYDYLCKSVNTFTDIKQMAADIWEGFNIEDERKTKKIASILSTALGLAVPRDTDEIVVSKEDDIFKHLPIKEDEVEIILGRRPEDLYGNLDD